MKRNSARSFNLQKASNEREQSKVGRWEMNVSVKYLLLLACINHRRGSLANLKAGLVTKGGDTPYESPVLVTVIETEGGGFKIWPFCRAQSSFDNFLSILPYLPGKQMTDARCRVTTMCCQISSENDTFTKVAREQLV